jgi:hypothetical protein
MHTPEELRLSAQRDDIYEYMCDRFKTLIAEDRHEDALALADEFYEWLDPNQLEEEETHYYDERELIKLHAQLSD